MTLGCGARTDPLLDKPGAEQCQSTSPTCIALGFGCDPATVVSATCNESTHAWVCPSGSQVYARAPASSASCLPFRQAHGLGNLGDWGLGSLARVPTDDGRCLWIADSATLSDGSTARNVAFDVDRTAPFGTCPSDSVMQPTPVVILEGGDDPSILVQIDGGYRLAGQTHVIYRLFRYDSTAVFGVTEIGGGVAHWDPGLQRIVVPSPSQPFPWGTDLDLGDAMLGTDDDPAHAFVWGCGLPGDFLKQSCRLARLDSADTAELFSRSGDWIASVRATDGPSVFESGRWTSSVIHAPGGFRHVYIADFGGEVLSQVATSVTGTWTESPSLGACDLPTGDAHAMCAGPIAHMEIADPTRPGEIPIAYGLGTTGTPVADADAYWTRLVWLQP